MKKVGALRIAKDTPTLRELTRKKLREAIIKQHFKPNERLIEQNLCEQTGVSRTCVREALQHLESEGLVVRRPNRRLFVATITPDQARQIYEIRAALEPTMGRYFAERASDRDIAALLGAVAYLENAIKNRAVDDYVAGLDRFYDILLAGARNEFAQHFLQTLRARITYLRTLTSRKSDQARETETVRLMKMIAASAAQRDGKDVAKRCAAFVKRSADFALRVLGDESTQSGKSR